MSTVAVEVEVGWGGPTNRLKSLPRSNNKPDRPSVMSCSTPAFCQVDVFGVNDSQMTGEGIVSAEGLLLGTQRTVDLEFPRIVNRILVSREIVRSGEDGVAGLSG